MMIFLICAFALLGLVETTALLFLIVGEHTKKYAQQYIHADKSIFGVELYLLGVFGIEIVTAVEGGAKDLRKKTKIFINTSKKLGLKVFEGKDVSIFLTIDKKTEDTND